MFAVFCSFFLGELLAVRQTENLDYFEQRVENVNFLHAGLPPSLSEICFEQFERACEEGWKVLQLMLGVLGQGNIGRKSHEGRHLAMASVWGKT